MHGLGNGIIGNALLIGVDGLGNGIIGNALLIGWIRQWHYWECFIDRC